MKITPLDLRQQQFTRTWRGYDPEEVDALLEAAAFELETLLKEQQNLQEQGATLEDELAEARAEESEIKQMLLAAHQVREDLVAQATKEAQLILKEARLRGDDFLRQCREKDRRITTKLTELERQYQTFRARLRGLLETHLQLLEESGRDLVAPERRDTPSSEDGNSLPAALAEKEKREPAARASREGRSAPAAETLEFPAAPAQALAAEPQRP